MPAEFWEDKEDSIPVPLKEREGPVGFPKENEGGLGLLEELGEYLNLWRGLVPRGTRTPESLRVKRARACLSTSPSHPCRQ